MIKTGYISVLTMPNDKILTEVICGDKQKIKAAIPVEVEHMGKTHTVYKRRKLYSITAYDCLGYAYPTKVTIRGGDMIVTRVIRGDIKIDGGIEWRRHEDGNPIQAGRCDVVMGTDGHVYELKLDIETLAYEYSIVDNPNDLFAKVGHPYGLCYFVSQNDGLLYGQYDPKAKVIQWQQAQLIK